MAQEELIEFVNRQTWLDPAADVLQKAIENAYSATGRTGQQVKNVLSGTWLGHPLHSAATDLPIGCWTASFVFDLLEAATGDATLARAADATQTVGLVGALAAALSGLNDWHFTIGRPRRLGVAHGMLNLTAGTIYATSTILRLRGARVWGRQLSFLAYGIAFFSAYVGGDLAYNERIGMNHAPEGAPEDFVPVLSEGQLREGKPRRVEASGVPVMLVRQGHHIYALGETCAHLGGPLSEGQIADGMVTCPWHASQFALADGHIINGPATYPQPCFQTRVRNGKIEVGPRCELARAEVPATSTQPESEQGSEMAAGAHA
jgi:nitrite reductase/ring-hydroxylating ferredoxin subunit/uncharacterized membrane protein